MNIRFLNYFSLVLLLVFLQTQLFAQQTKWVNRGGGSFPDVGEGVATDLSGNVYVIGTFQDKDTIYGLSSNGSDDIFLAAFNSTGKFKWAKNFGGSLSDKGHGITLDSNGNIYIVGEFASSSMKIDTATITNTNASGKSNYFFAKLNSSGDVYFAVAGGTNTIPSVSNRANAIVLDSNLNIFVTGVDNSKILLNKYDNTGSKQWAKTLSISGLNEGFGLAINKTQDVYVTGVLGNDAFVARYLNTGSQSWQKTFGGTISADYGYGVAVDDSSNAYITGSYVSTATFGSFSIPGDFSGNMFLCKINPSGTTIKWVKTGASTGIDEGRAVIVNDDDVYVTGFFTGSGTFNGTKLSGTDKEVFVAKYTTDGILQFGKSFGGDAADKGKAIFLSEKDELIITGDFGGTAKFDSLSIKAEGFTAKNDWYVFKLSNTPDIKINVAFKTTDTVWCANGNPKTIGLSNLSNVNYGKVNYEWDFNDGSPIDTNRSIKGHSFASGGTYNVQLTCYGEYNNFKSTIITLIADTVAQPLISISKKYGGVLVVKKDPRVVSYLWTVGTTTVGTADSFDTKNVKGTYKLTVFDQYGCSNYSKYVVTALNEDFELNRLTKIYPNPSNGKVYVNCSNVELQNLEVYNAQGQEINCSNYDHASRTYIISLPSSGIYFLRATVEGLSYSSKIMMN